MKLTVIGMLSGTSYDAIDAAAADLELIDQQIFLRPRGLHSHTIPAPLRGRIAKVLPPHATTVDEICRLDTELGQLFGAVASTANRALADGKADLVVSHGQTLYHWVDSGQARGTLQVGAASWISEATGLPTISDLRTRDITRGGHGAPLASTLDALLVLSDGVRRGSLNLGGIANITIRGPDDEIVAYDIGPANALIDNAVSDATDGFERMDANGLRATRGNVNQRVLHQLLTEPYYRLPPPKSTGKELFHAGYVREALAGTPIGTDDLVATLTELTARLVSESCHVNHLTELIVAGGGVRNPALMNRIAELCEPCSVRLIDEFGLPAQAKEAYLFALLGYLSMHGLPGTIPSATGARARSILGSFTPGDSPLHLPQVPDQPPCRIHIL